MFPTLLCLWVCGCATGYHPAKDGGRGYSDSQVSSNEFTVGFKGNGQTSLEQAYDFAMLHAAELALTHGFHYFAVLDVTNTSSAKNYTMRQRYYANSLLDGGLGPPSPGGYDPVAPGYIVEVEEPRTFFQPGTTFFIKCFTTKPAKPFTYNSAELRDTLKEKYHLARK